jgi:hypothetical protein
VGFETKKPLVSQGFIASARMTGLEPATSGVTGWSNAVFIKTGGRCNTLSSHDFQLTRKPEKCQKKVRNGAKIGITGGETGGRISGQL